jgi:chromosome segregation ATPase
MEGMQVELKHVREEARALSTTLTRFTSQTPRMDDILEMRERLGNLEPLAPHVSSLQASFAEAKDTSVLLKQLIKSLEDRCNKTDSGIASLGATISNTVNPSIAKVGHEMSVLDADVARLSAALNGLKDSVQAQATSNADRWDSYKRNIEDKLSQQQDSTKSSLQSYGL